MDYILDGIKTILEYSGLIILLGVIYLLIKFYKERDVDEDYLAFKLIGFYILGGFTFDIEIFMTFIIPVGYCIYYLWMKPKDRLNKEIKHKSANLGLIVLGIGIVSGFIYNGLEYRDTFVETTNNSVSGIEEDYKLIEEKLKLNNYITVNYFNMYFDKNNNIESISYSFEKEDKIYNISKSNEEDFYTINIDKKEDEMIGWDGVYIQDNVESNQVEIKEFLRAISNIKFDTSKIDKDRLSYNLSYDSMYNSTNSEQDTYGDNIYYIDDYEKYTYKKAEKRDLPISGAIIFFEKDTYVLYPEKHMKEE